MAEVLTTMYAIAGINFAKCACGGAIPISLDLNAIAKIDHTCDEVRKGSCKRCSRTYAVRFIRPMAPNLKGEYEK
jgi:hypothetical protein